MEIGENNGKKKSKKKIIGFSILAVLIIGVIIAVFTGSSGEEFITVTTAKAEKRDITQTVTATGKINPVYQVIITPEVTGEIVELPVKEGDKVKKGDLLIKIKPDIYIAQRNRASANLNSAQAQLKIIEANLKLQQSEYARLSGLYEKGFVSDSEMETGKTMLSQREGELSSQHAIIIQSREALKEAEEQLAKTTIYSPLEGTVSQLNVELGERVLGSNFTQGTHIMTVADLREMEATVDVNENDVRRVSINDTAKITIDAFGEEEFNGIVTQIGNSAKTSNTGTQNEVINFEIKIKLLEPDQTIRPGMSCDAVINTETKLDVLSVPITAVTSRPELEDSLSGKKNGRPQEIVFMAKGGKAVIEKVKSGISDDNYIEIVEGLKDGQEIITGPHKAVSKDINENAKIKTDSKPNMKNKK